GGEGREDRAGPRHAARDQGRVDADPGQGREGAGEAKGGRSGQGEGGLHVQGEGHVGRQGQGGGPASRVLHPLQGRLRQGGCRQGAAEAEAERGRGGEGRGGRK